MSRAGNLLYRVDDFFFAKLPVYPLVVCRIAFGLILFFAYATKSTHIQYLFGPDGLSGAAFHSRAPMDWPHGRALESSIQWLHLSSSESLVWILWAGLMISALSFALGFRTRTSGVIALLLHTSLHAQNYTATLGWAVMIKPFMAYVIMSRAGEFASLDAYIRRRRGSSAPVASRVSAWPLRLLQIHVCTMYLVAGSLRVVEPSWQNGEMLFVALNDQWYSRFSFDWLGIRNLLRPLSMGPFILEPLAPVLLWLRHVGPVWALGLMSMHLVLEIMSNVGWWQYVMVASLTAFLPTAWIEWLFLSKNQGSASIGPVREDSRPVSNRGQCEGPFTAGSPGSLLRNTGALCQRKGSGGAGGKGSRCRSFGRQESKPGCSVRARLHSNVPAA